MLYIRFPEPILGAEADPLGQFLQPRLKSIYLVLEARRGVFPTRLLGCLDCSLTWLEGLETRKAPLGSEAQMCFSPGRP